MISQQNESEYTMSYSMSEAQRLNYKSEGMKNDGVPSLIL